MTPNMPTVEPMVAGPPPPTGIAAYGTQIQVLSSGVGVTPETYVTIAGVGDITGPNPQVAEVETTSHSTGSPHRSFMPALIDDGQLSFPMYWFPTDPTQSASSQYGMEYLFQNRLTTKYRIINTDPGHRTRVVSGFVKQLNETYPIAGLCTKAVIIRLCSAAVDVTPVISTTPTSASPVAAGGAATFSVATAGNNTPWLPVSDVLWITVSSPTTNTVGDATVDYSVAVNAVASPARTGHINIPQLNLVFTVNQAAG